MDRAVLALIATGVLALLCYGAIALGLPVDLPF